MRSAILLLSILMLSACASVDDSKKTITLDNDTRHYERAIRWGEYENANIFRKQSTANPVEAAHFKTIKVTGYETKNIVESENRSKMQIDVEIHYYNEYTLKEKTIIDHQTWEYDPIGKSWFITSPMPAFN